MTISYPMMVAAIAGAMAYMSLESWPIAFVFGVAAFILWLYLPLPVTNGGMGTEVSERYWGFTNDDE